MIDQSLIIKYLDGELSPEESQVVLDWLNESQENRDYLFSLKSGLLVMNADRDRKSADTDREWKRLRSRLSVREKNPIPRTSFALAAGLALLFALGWFLGSKRQVPERLAGDITIQTGVGQQTSANLPDGTVLLLNDCSRLTYNPLDWKKSRSVNLTGQASFEVVHMAKFPFRVKTTDFEVEVTGTSFDIASYPGEETSTVSLKNGSVTVCFPGSSQSAPLAPGESLVYLPSSRTYSIRRLSDKQTYAWEEGAISFKDQTLKEKSGELYRRYGYRLEIDENCAHDTFTALFDEDSIVNVLDVIAQISPGIQYQINPETKTIRIWK